MRNFGICLVWCLVGCSKSEPPLQPAPGSSPAIVKSSTAEVASSAAPAAAPVAQAAPGPATADSAPASFKGGSKETIAGAAGLGCEATSPNGWLQLLCRKKNGTGGHPVRAVVHRPGEAPATPSGQEPGGDAPAPDAPSGDELAPNEQGELTIVVPYSGDEKRDVNIVCQSLRLGDGCDPRRAKQSARGVVRRSVVVRAASDLRSLARAASPAGAGGARRNQEIAVSRRRG